MGRDFNRRDFQRCRILSIGAALACAIIAFASGASAATVAFNPGDLSQFTLNGSSSTDYSITAGTGIGGSSGLTSTGGGLAVLNQSSTNLVGQLNAVSIAYKQGTSDAGTDTRIGFVAAPNAGSSFFNLSTSANLWEQSIPFNGTSNNRSVTVGSGLTILPLTTVLANEWYRLELTIQRRPDNAYNVTSRRWDLGPTGTSAPTLVQAQTITYAFSTLSTASQIYAGFEAYSWTAGYDDFAVSNVPEPSAAFMLAGLAALYRRRR